MPCKQELSESCPPKTLCTDCNYYEEPGSESKFEATQKPDPLGSAGFALLDACRELVKLHHEYKDCDSWEGDKFSDMHIKWQDTVSKVIAETEKAESS